jgi:hypothetical protein
MFQCRFLKALIVPERIEHRIEPEQRRSEWHACSQCALLNKFPQRFGETTNYHVGLCVLDEQGHIARIKVDALW